MEFLNLYHNHAVYKANIVYIKPSSLPSTTKTTTKNNNYNMKVFIAIISALLAVAAAAPSEEASGPQADAGVQVKIYLKTSQNI